MSIRYLGLARVKGDEDVAISLSSIRDELLPGLLAVGRKNRMRVESYVEFETDVLVIKAEVGEPGSWVVMKIARSEVEDGKHIEKLREFLMMCGSKGSTPVTQSQALAEYQKLAQQQLGGISPYSQGLSSADWNGYGQDLARIVRKAMADNQYKAEFEPNPVPQVSVPQISARELTKEELKERVARKLDLEEVKATTAAEVVNHARWRQIMDEVFKDKPKGEDDGKAQEDGTVSNGRRHGGKDGG